MPEIEFSTLENVPLNTILNTFNKSFSDYFIPFQMTLEQFKAKIANEDVQMNLSVGSFSGKEMVGLILHAKRVTNGKLVIYNALTGVVPAYRGNNLTEKMYKFALDILKPLEPHHLVLEVIEQNHPAVKSYGRVGYDKVRLLRTFKGQVPPADAKFEIKEIKKPDWDYLQTFWDCHPSWQNDTPTLLKPDTGKTFGVTINDQIVGYIHYSILLKRIVQMAVKHGFRGRGMGKALIAHLAQFDQEATITNVDNKADGMVKFFESIGWGNYVNIYEMVMPME